MKPDYTSPPMQKCGCHAPHFLCPVGGNLRQHWERLGVDVDVALASKDDARFREAQRVRAAAENAYLRHIGVRPQEPEHDIVAGYDWTEIDRDGYPALLKVCRALAVRVLALEAARPYTTMTPPPYFTAGYPQEPELDA